MPTIWPGDAGGTSDPPIRIERIRRENYNLAPTVHTILHCTITLHTDNIILDHPKIELSCIINSDLEPQTHLLKSPYGLVMVNLSVWPWRFVIGEGMDL